MNVRRAVYIRYIWNTLRVYWHLLGYDVVANGLQAGLTILLSDRISAFVLHRAPGICKHNTQYANRNFDSHLSLIQPDPMWLMWLCRSPGGQQKPVNLEQVDEQGDSQDIGLGNHP